MDDNKQWAEVEHQLVELKHLVEDYMKQYHRVRNALATIYEIAEAIQQTGAEDIDFGVQTIKTIAFQTLEEN